MRKHYRFSQIIYISIYHYMKSLIYCAMAAVQRAYFIYSLVHSYTFYIYSSQHFSGKFQRSQCFLMMTKMLFLSIGIGLKRSLNYQSLIISFEYKVIKKYNIGSSRRGRENVVVYNIYVKKKKRKKITQRKTIHYWCARCSVQCPTLLRGPLTTCVDQLISPLPLPIIEPALATNYFSVVFLSHELII